MKDARLLTALGVALGATVPFAQSSGHSWAELPPPGPGDDGRNRVPTDLAVLDVVVERSGSSFARFYHTTTGMFEGQTLHPGHLRAVDLLLPVPDLATAPQPLVPPGAVVNDPVDRWNDALDSTAPFHAGKRN